MSSTITGTTSVTSSTTAAQTAMKKEIGMDKNDFLKLFIAQLQNQDPLKPQDPTEFLGQLAQLTQVEQAYNSAAALEKLLAAQDNNLAMTSVGFIGKSVVAAGNLTAFDGTNPPTLSYLMPSATTATTLKVSDSTGKVVRTVDLGSLAAGNGSYQWDGKDGQGSSLAAGSYSFSITGTNAVGKQQSATTYITGKVDGVRFDNGKAYVTIGAVSIPFTDVTTVKAS